MKCLRITGNPHLGRYDVSVMGENRMKANEDTHDTVMQVLRLRLQWDINNDQKKKNNRFDYIFPITF